jgi:poly-beta-hydroxybutyrate-responsive repressor
MLKECGCHSRRTAKFLMPSLLLLLVETPSYGYQLMDNLDKKGLQEGPSDPAATYRILRQLEEEGMVTSKWDTKAAGPARRSYRITAKGCELLEAWALAIEQRKARLERFLALYRNSAGALRKVRKTR